MSAPYADLYLLPLPKRSLAAYRKGAAAAGKVFRRHGALEYREFVADDIAPTWGPLPFPKLVKARRGETVIAAVVGFRSRAHRDRAMKRVMADPAMGRIMSGTPPFDVKRMAYGGFRGIVDA